VARVVDPLAGSYYVETLTDAIETDARALVAEVDALGGAARAIELGFFQEAIARSAYDLEKEDAKVRASYGNHLGGQSMLLARRLTEAGVPIVQGRNFLVADTPDSPGVAIINEAMARKYWPNQDPLGKRFRATTFTGP
jgi:hypothetical protein